MGSRQCPYCGAYLDPGERCDCQDEPGEDEKEPPSGVADPEGGKQKYYTTILTDRGGNVNGNRES